MLDMPVMGEVQNEPNLTNTDCVGQNELCKVESFNNLKTLKQGSMPSQIDDMFR